MNSAENNKKKPRHAHEGDLTLVNVNPIWIKKFTCEKGSPFYYTHETQVDDLVHIQKEL